MFVIYIFTDSTRARFRGKRVKNIPRSWVWADRFPFNDLFHAIIYFIAWINVDSSLSRGHWKLENWKENDNFFFNFLEFSILQRKNFIYHSIKKKKIPSNFINKFPVQQMFSRDHPFLSSRKSMLSHTIEYQKIDEENFFIIIFFFFFFSNFTRVPFPRETLRKSGENFTEFSFIDYYDYFLRRIVDSPFSYPIEYQKIAFDEGKRSRFLATRV